MGVEPAVRHDAAARSATSSNERLTRRFASALSCAESSVPERRDEIIETTESLWCPGNRTTQEKRRPTRVGEAADTPCARDRMREFGRSTEPAGFLEHCVAVADGENRIPS